MIMSRQNDDNVKYKVRKVIDDLKDGEFPMSLLADPEVFELELKTIFARAWHFLAHESEIPSAGDYVSRYIGPYYSIVVARGEDGNVRAFLNLCTHKGRGFCRTESGNAAYFRCPFHFWTFSNTGELIGVALEKDGYNGELDKSQYGLVTVRVESYNGFIFGTLDKNAETLKDYLGEFSWYFDLATKRSGGLEFYTPQRWIANFNWKLGAENFSTDAYHTAYTHKSAADLGLPSMGPFGRKVSQKGYHFASQKGHGGGMRGALTNEKEKASVILPLFYPKWAPTIVENFEKSLSKEQMSLLSRAASSMRWTIFPNFSFLTHPMGSFDADSIDQDFPYGMPVPWLHFKIWRPLSPTQTEIWNFFAVEKDAPKEFKERSYRAYVHAFGPSGMFEADDIENWTTITRNSMALSTGGKEILSPYKLGAYKKDLSDFVWKDRKEVGVYSEVSENAGKAYWTRWADMLTEGL